MLELRPSRVVMALYLLSLLALVTGLQFSSLSGMKLWLVLLVSLAFMVSGCLFHWRNHRGVLLWQGDQILWLNSDGAGKAVTIVAAAGWSDWILRIEILPSLHQGVFRWPWLRRYLMLLPDNSDSESRRKLRVYLLHRFSSESA